MMIHFYFCFELLYQILEKNYLFFFGLRSPLSNSFKVKFPNLELLGKSTSKIITIETVKEKHERL